MGQKIKNGGSVGVAKLGYENVRVKHEARAARSAPSLSTPCGRRSSRWPSICTRPAPTASRKLRDTPTDAGLSTKGTGRYGPRPIPIHAIGNLLHDGYYLGYVTYDGVEYPGRHEPLIDHDLFGRVQKVLNAEHNAGTRRRVHEHYLHVDLRDHQPGGGVLGGQQMHLTAVAQAAQRRVLPSTAIARRYLRVSGPG